MMRSIFFPAVVIAALVSCNKSHETSAQTVTSGASGDTTAPVETRKANTSYPAAFKGQTRAPGLKTKTPYETSIVTKSLDSPWGIAPLPDGRLLITENQGYMVIVDVKNAKVSKPIKGIPAVDDRGQGGLLGLTLDPDFERNRMVYWVFSEKMGNGNHTAVAKGKLPADESSIQNATVIYRATPTYDGTLHYGGRIIFDKEGHLFVSTGERSDKKTRAQAQDLSSGLGKIIRITTDGKPVKGNPFENRKGARPEIFSYGHRNPQGLAFDPRTGKLWSNEFGPRGGDELNLIKPGVNYGWPVITYGVEYSGSEIGNPPIQKKDGMEQPVYYWDPVLSPSGMAFYTSDRIPEWKNNLFIGGLNSTHIARVVIENDKVVGEERILAREGQRFRDLAQGKDGALYAITQAGVLYKIDKK